MYIVGLIFVPTSLLFQNCAPQQSATSTSDQTNTGSNNPPPPTNVPPTNGIAELPRAYVDTTMPIQTGATINVGAGGNLQTAINNAVPGDTIVLAAGATFKGEFTLPKKNNPQNKWIVIKSSQTASLPAEGKRVTPAQANLMPKIIAEGAGQVIIADQGANYYRFIGIEVTDSGDPSPYGPDLPGGGNGGFNQGLIDLGRLGRDTTLAHQPHHIIFDRCYIHGKSNTHIKYGLSMEGAHLAVIDSYLSAFKGIGQDTQAIRSFHGRVLKINNNYLEGAGENVMFGGADPSIPNIIPSDIEMRGNYIFKPLTWKIGHVSYAGIPWLVKNLFETKACQRLLFEGNIMENSWTHGQTGFAFVLKSSNQDGNCTWCVSGDLTIRYNIIKNADHGTSLHTLDEYSGGGGIPQQKVSIIHNIFENVGYRLFQITGPSSQGPQRNLEIINNTVWGNATDEYPAFVAMGDGPGHVVNGLKIQNNVFYHAGAHQGTSVMGSGQTWGLPSLNYYASNHDVRGNAYIRSHEGANAIPNNQYVPVANAGFKNVATRDFELLSTSPLKGTGVDGKDPGADIPLVKAITSRTISGQ